MNQIEKANIPVDRSLYFMKHNKIIDKIIC